MAKLNLNSYILVDSVASRRQQVKTFTQLSGACVVKVARS